MSSKKSLFNFYLDDDLKQDLQAKLVRLTNDTPKGQLASLIRVLLKQFNATPDDKINKDLVEAIVAEYVFSQTLNKRSRM